MSFNEVLIYSFDLFNRSGNGFLTSLELRKSCATLHGSMFLEAEESVCSLSEIIDNYEAGGINHMQFLRNITMFPVLTMPVFATQTRLRGYIMGERFWKLREVQSVRLKRDAEFVRVYESTRSGLSTRLSAQTSSALVSLDDVDADQAYEELMSRYQDASSYTSRQRKSHTRSRDRSNSQEKSNSNNHSQPGTPVSNTKGNPKAFTFDNNVGVVATSKSGSVTPCTNVESDKSVPNIYAV
jgi:hypothetical protein